MPINRSHGDAEVPNRHAIQAADWTTAEAYLATIQSAFRDAVEDFVNKHGRNPYWDELNFNGGATTLNVVVELEEYN